LTNLLADTRVVSGVPIAYTLGLLQIRQYDPTGNLRKAGG